MITDHIKAIKEGKISEMLREALNIMKVSEILLIA
jgi:hypothetical protein